MVGEFTLGSEYKGYVGSIRLTDKKFASFEFLVKEGGVSAKERGGKVKVNEEGAFQYDAEKEGIIGVFKSNDKGFGFVHYDDKEEDVFINPDNTMFAVQGDEVRVKYS
ncbi:hypothetical protein H7R52_05245 [Weissella confusa]|uniref:Ribonuclease B N-terminal OB domain-containing protein n=1 Tax=Weissella confusa TaxID=1583 RepID=A0A923ND94_WEICO|nr:hypothetical protein [Weissella confusa]